MRDYQIYKKIDHIIKTRNKCLYSQNKGDEDYRFLGMFKYCLFSMKEEFKLILDNSYFKKKYQFWWVDYYCKSSYYRKRFKAVSAFVALFEMIYENFNDDSYFINFAKF